MNPLGRRSVDDRDTSDLQIIDRTTAPRVPRFAIESRIGSGGQATVWRARRTADGEEVALKIWPETATAKDRERFDREVSALNALRGQANIVGFVASSAPGEAPAWIVTHLCDGSLADRLQQGPLPATEVFDIVDDVLSGLATIHAAGLLHRDLKPNNVLLIGGRAVLCDLGLTNPVGGFTSLAAAGTAPYVAPELGRSQPSVLSDIYAAGVLTDHLFADVPITQALEQLIVTATSSNPSDRPPTAAELRHRFAELRRPTLTAAPAELRPRAAAPMPSSGTDTAQQQVTTSQQPTQPRVTPEVAARPALERAPGRRRTAPVMAALAVSGVAGALAVAYFQGLLPTRDGDPELTASTVTASSAAASPSVKAAAKATPTPTPSPAPSAAAGTVAPLPVPQGAVTNPKPAPNPAAKQSAAAGEGGAGAKVTPKPSAVTTYAPSASSALSTGGRYAARVHFGQLGSLVDTLGGQVSFNIAPSMLQQHAGECALTVIVKGVSGSDAVIYANDLGSGWWAAESAPDKSPSTDDGVVHQQVIMPPVGQEPGASWSGSARVDVDDVPTTTSVYRLTRMQDASGLQVWNLNGSLVRCTS